jgi:hypothetical protein
MEDRHLPVSAKDVLLHHNGNTATMKRKPFKALVAAVRAIRPKRPRLRLVVSNARSPADDGRSCIGDGIGRAGSSQPTTMLFNAITARMPKPTPTEQPCSARSPDAGGVIQLLSLLLGAEQDGRALYWLRSNLR